MNLSKTKAKVWFAGQDSDAKSIFRAMVRESKAPLAFNELSKTDQAMMPALAAKFKSEDLQSQAMAGLFMGAAGITAMADEYYKKAGDDFTNKIPKIFE